jgi:hypothetical protein
MGGFGSARWGLIRTRDPVETSYPSTSTALIEADACNLAIAAAWNGNGKASGSPRSGFGETRRDWFYRIGSGGTMKNGRRSNSQLRSSGSRADSAELGPISFARASSMDLPAVDESPSSTEPGRTSSAVIVIGWPMPRSAKIVMTGHCGGPTKYACSLAESRA